AAGKRSPIVRLGTQKGAQLLVLFTGSIYPLTLLFVLLGISPAWTLLSWVSLPLLSNYAATSKENHNQPDKVSNCKFIAVAVHFWA
ncbi:2-carboxy-1,4-naphthoquinone phytyltransferase, partial [Nostoc sp. HG1]|nr:2-carboxy-1,4-naphthoquinone phytyltransferase [Nostoc sp. HG1]